MRRAPIQRKTRLKSTRARKWTPGASLKLNPPKRRSEIVSLIWRRDLGPCVVCPFEGGTCRGPVQAHHIVGAHTLRKRGLNAHLMDLRNRLSVCEHRHEQHTNGYRPIPRELLTMQVFEFADELGLGWYLDKHYPIFAQSDSAAEAA